MKQLTIILVGMSSRVDWEQGILTKNLQRMQGGVVNRNYHVLQTLLRRPEVEKVISVDFLPYNLRKSIKQGIQTHWWRRTKTTQAKGLTWRLEAVTGKWWSLSSLRVNALTQLKSYINPETQMVIWSYHPFFPEVFSQLPGAIIVFDTVDNWAEHPAYAKYTKRLKNNYSEIDSSADYIFTVSSDLKKLFPKNSQVTWVPNGVDVQHFSTPHDPQEFNVLPQPFVVYCGVIQDRFDVKLVAATAALLPQIYWVIAGPVWKGMDLTSLNLPNVRLIGPVNYRQLPNLLARASCGIIPHKINQFTASMNPLKLYEYLAAGLPVVSTPIKGTEQFPSGVLTASTPQEFAAAIQKALTYSPEQKIRLRQLIIDQTWDTRVQLMLKKIEP